MVTHSAPINPTGKFATTYSRRGTHRLQGVRDRQDLCLRQRSQDGHCPQELSVPLPLADGRADHHLLERRTVQRPRMSPVRSYRHRRCAGGVVQEGQLAEAHALARLQYQPPVDSDVAGAAGEDVVEVTSVTLRPGT